MKLQKYITCLWFFVVGLQPNEVIAFKGLIILPTLATGGGKSVHNLQHANLWCPRSICTLETINEQYGEPPQGWLSKFLEGANFLNKRPRLIIGIQVFSWAVFVTSMIVGNLSSALLPHQVRNYIVYLMLCCFQFAGKTMIPFTFVMLIPLTIIMVALSLLLGIITGGVYSNGELQSSVLGLNHWLRMDTSKLVIEQLISGGVYLYLALLGPILEETFFPQILPKIIQQKGRSQCPSWRTTTICSALFAMAHVQAIVQNYGAHSPHTIHHLFQ